MATAHHHCHIRVGRATDPAAALAKPVEELPAAAVRLQSSYARSMAHRAWPCRGGPGGDVAEWLRSGLQIRVRRFDSGRRLQYLTNFHMLGLRLGLQFCSLFMLSRHSRLRDLPKSQV